MLPKKRLPPMRRRVEKSDKNEEDIKIREEEEDGKMMEEFASSNVNNNEYERRIPKKPENNNNNVNANFEFPEFLRNADNEQYLQLFIRMRQRHNADGAVSLHIDADDIADQNLELYDNKGINIEPPLMNENLADNVEYYIESVNRDQYFKISKKVMDDLEKEKEKEKRVSDTPRKKMDEKALLAKMNGKSMQDDDDVIRRPKKITEIGRATEDQLFAEFDLKLTEIIYKTSSKVALLFLFAQGLLAGVSLVNILLLFQYSNFASFLAVYSFNVREIFNFTHFLTFGSLVGNGIKFISSYKRYKFEGSEYIQSESRSILKKSMIFSGVILILFTIIFAILMYLASYIPRILYAKYTTEVLIEESSFQIFSILYSICNFIAILCFILNIFDVKVNDDISDKPNNYNTSTNYDPDETRENSLVNF